MITIQDIKNIFTEPKPGSPPDIRLNICKTCSEYREVSKQCAQCNCLMPLKARIFNAECPLDKWPESTLDEWKAMQ
jgi:hypothetical protein